MKTIAELLKLEAAGVELTSQELDYIANYKRNKQFRHSSKFIYHSRKLPKEDND